MNLRNFFIISPLSGIINKNVKTVMFYIFISPFIYALLLVVSLTTYTIGLYCLNKGSVTSLDTVISLMSNNTSVIPVFIYLALLYAYIELTLYRSKSSSFVIALYNYLIYHICNVLGIFLLFVISYGFIISIVINIGYLGMILTLVLLVVQYRYILNMFWVLHEYKVRYYTGIFVFVFLSLGTILYIFQPVVLVDLWNTYIEVKTTTPSSFGGCWVLPENVSTAPLYPGGDYYKHKDETTELYVTGEAIHDKTKEIMENLEKKGAISNDDVKSFNKDREDLENKRLVDVEKELEENREHIPLLSSAYYQTEVSMNLYNEDVYKEILEDRIQAAKDSVKANNLANDPLIQETLEEIDELKQEYDADKEVYEQRAEYVKQTIDTVNRNRP